MSSTLTRVKLGDLWPGPWPKLGTGPRLGEGPDTNKPTPYDGYMAWKRWQAWRRGEKPGRWYGQYVTIIWSSYVIGADPPDSVRGA